MTAIERNYARFLRRSCVDPYIVALMFGVGELAIEQLWTAEIQEFQIIETMGGVSVSSV